MIEQDTVLTKYRTAIRELFGARIERIVLYGSRARGDAEPDSDYDIAVFLSDLQNRFQEGRQVADVELCIMDDTDAIVHTLLFPAGYWQDRSSPLMSEIRNDGLDL